MRKGISIAKTIFKSQFSAIHVLYKDGRYFQEITQQEALDLASRTKAAGLGFQGLSGLTPEEKDRVSRGETL